ncbi:Cyclin-A1-1 [Platanthera zijinensis]|uniref:Cyclin-A1-1 n=1 Tax=Platanthera zijinensis TaxID=2320716 RepID=A0AAP0BH94_9ASPA
MSSCFFKRQTLIVVATMTLHNYIRRHPSRTDLEFDVCDDDESYAYPEVYDHTRRRNQNNIVAIPNIDPEMDEGVGADEMTRLRNRIVNQLQNSHRQATYNLHISDHADSRGNAWKSDGSDIEMARMIANVDDNDEDPQLCATLACDVYKHLRLTETRKCSSTDFMDKVKKDINASKHAILVDWLVEVAEEYRLAPDTLYLTVNYIDRYLSGDSFALLSAPKGRISIKTMFELNKNEHPHLPSNQQFT